MPPDEALNGRVGHTLSARGRLTVLQDRFLAFMRSRPLERLAGSEWGYQMGSVGNFLVGAMITTYVMIILWLLGTLLLLKFEETPCVETWGSGASIYYRCPVQP